VKYKTGGDFDTGGGFLKAPGTFHFCITGVEENPTKKGKQNEGQLIDNAAFRVDLEVLAGTADGCVGKTCDIVFFHPKPSDKNEGAFAKKKIDRFLLAVNLVKEEDKEKELDIDLNLATGSQLVAKMELNEDGKHVGLAFADIFHVDDPAVAQVPKDAEALQLIAPSKRRIGSQPKKDKAAVPPKKDEKKEPPAPPVTEEFDL
jgi:hypothetical protein